MLGVLKMAHGSYTFDQAGELLRGWYRTIRVENLADDEVLNELQSRKVIMNPSLSNEQRREMLKNRLAQEKSGEAEAGTRYVVGNPEAEIDTCTDRFDVLNKLMTPNVEEETRSKCQDRLIHLGIRLITVLRVTRGPSELLSSLQTMVVDLTNLLYVFYEPPLPDPDTDSEPESEPPNPTNPRAIGSVFTQDDLDFIHDLQARIADLEGQLSYKKPTREMGTLTPRVSFQNESGSFNTKTPLNSSPEPVPNPTPTPHPTPYPVTPYFNYNDPCYNSHQNPNYPGCSSYPYHNPYSHPSHNLVYPTHSQNSFYPNNPQLPYRPDLPPIFNPSFNRNHPQSNDSTPPNQFNNRRSLPVSKWNIVKYSGDDQGLKLNEFLETVHAFSAAEHVTTDELFASAIHLFTGSALSWYMNERAVGRLMNWDHLVFELRRTYMHPDLDSLMRMKIYSRKQQKHESFHDFSNEVERMFRSMQYQLPEFEKAQILHQNMRTDYKRQLTFVSTPNLYTLVSAARKLDAHNFSAYNKVFGIEKSVHVVSNPNQPNKKKQREPVEETVNAVNQTARPPQNQNQNNRNQSQNQQRIPAANPQQQQPQRNQQQQQSSGSPGIGQQRHPGNQAGSSGSLLRPQVTLEDLLNAHAPPPENTCYNCGRLGHHFVMCRESRGLFCGHCGLRGFPSEFCPFCIKNANATNQNRRS